MDDRNSIQKTGIPLHQQLLALIPVLKIIEDSRNSSFNRLAPLRLDVTHRPSGALSLALSEDPFLGDDPDAPEMTIAIHSNTRNNRPLTYQEAFVFAWTYLCSSSSMNEAEQSKMYELFLVTWASYVIRLQETVKTMGLE